MRLEARPNGLAIIPTSPEDGYQIGYITAHMLSDICIQRDQDDTVLVVNTKEIAEVDKVLPWRGSGMSRVGFIKDLLAMRDEWRVYAAREAFDSLEES
jgi:hypothetical protein